MRWRRWMVIWSTDAGEVSRRLFVFRGNAYRLSKAMESPLWTSRVIRVEDAPPEPVLHPFMVLAGLHDPARRSKWWLVPLPVVSLLVSLMVTHYLLFSWTRLVLQATVGVAFGAGWAAWWLNPKKVWPDE